MLHIKEVIVVEGKYDKEALKRITDAPVVCTRGFNLYKNRSLINYLRNEARKNGLIILTDSDSAGFRIRNYLRQCIGSEGKISNAYIPTVEGKEKRKTVPGKEGLLGVEGIAPEILEKILKKASKGNEECRERKKITDKTEFFALGLSGGENSADMRKELAKELGLPVRISANAMIDIINKTVSEAEFKTAVIKLKDRKGDLI